MMQSHFLLYDILEIIEKEDTQTKAIELQFTSYPSYENQIGLLKIEFNKFGQELISEEFFVDGRLSNRISNEYDGNLIVSSLNETPWLDQQIITNFEYAQDQKIISEIEYHPDNIILKTIYEYDDEGLAYRQLEYDNDELTKEEIHDRQNYCMITNYYSEGTLVESMQSSYDQNGLLVKELIGNHTTVLYENDKTGLVISVKKVINGVCISEKSYNSTDATDESTFYDHEKMVKVQIIKRFDTIGNYVSKKVLINDEPSLLITYEISKNNEVIKESYSGSINGTIEYSYEYF